MAAAPNAETTSRLADLSLRTLERQLAGADALDAKAWQALAAGSILVGLAVAGALDGVWLLPLLPPYAVLAGAALACVRPRRWAAPGALEELWAHYWYRPVAELDHCLVEAMAGPDGERTNRAEIRSKSRLVGVALTALAVETIALAATAIAVGF